MLEYLWVRFRMAVHPRILAFLWKSHKAFSGDKDYSFLSLMKAIWKVSKHERIVLHEGRFVYSSFLPPLPSKAISQVLTSVAGEGSFFKKHTMAKRSAPISMYLSVTGRCQYRCRHCSAADRKERDELSTQEWISVIAQLQDMGTAMIGFTGGEPLLRSDIVELVASVDDRSETLLFTSGSGLDHDMARKLKGAGLFALGVSLDSCVSEVMDEQRGVGGAFQTALDAIQAGRRAGLYTMAQTVATKDMLESGALERLIERAKELGVHEVRILESLPTGRMLHTETKNLMGCHERKKLQALHEKLNLRRGYPKVSIFAHTEDFALFGCGAGTQHSYIDAAGHLCPCDFVPLSFGKVTESPVRELWAEMSKKIGGPRRRCMIMEMHHHLSRLGPTELPIQGELADKLIQSLVPMDARPGFYTALEGCSNSD